MTEPTIHNLEALLDASLPEFMAALRSQREWEWLEDDQGRAFFALEQLRLWLLDNGTADAWATVESLMTTSDPVLRNALAVGLLEGHWAQRQLELMGPRTRALHADL
jgi:hypothetical protein